MSLAKGRDLLRTKLTLEAPKNINGESYFGCRNHRPTMKFPSGGLATCHSYDMEDFMRSCVALYEELAPGVRLKQVSTPFLSDDHRDSAARGPAGDGPVDVCPWCEHPHAPNTWPSIEAYEKDTAKRRKQLEAETSAKSDSSVRGRLAPVAARILMKILYGARTARLDLLRAVSHLACFFTKWTPECDKKLHRLVSYIHSTYHVRMMGWVGDSLERLEPHMFADADFAGCVSTQRSTSGLFLCIRGPNTCFPVAGISKRQGCVSHSTPEAEAVAMDFALRINGLPSLILWEKLLPHSPGLFVHEDNQAMIRIVETGRNPTMRYIGRTHGISVAWLHETFKKDELTLAYELSSRMCADIFTKGFTDADKWRLPAV